jgi:hypothetical protein
MKKLITMLLAMGLLALLSLSTVAYADEGGNGKKDNGDNGKKDHKKVLLCIEKDDEFKLIEVKKDELEKYLEDDAFFPKAKVLEEDEDKAIVKFLCDFDNGDDKDDKKTIYPYQADNDENGENGHKAAAIGIRQTALVV